MNNILVTTTLALEGYKIKEYKGIISALVVRSPTIKQGFFGGIQSLTGGNITSFSEMCEQARTEAYDNIIKRADHIGANAIIGFKYDTSETSGKGFHATEIFCYGTAVIIIKDEILD